MSIGLTLKKNDSEGHKFIQTTNMPISGLITEASLLITNSYTKQNLSAKAWRKEKRTVQAHYEYPPGNNKISKPFNYLVISELLRSKGNFNPVELDLPEIECMWLDHSTEMKIDFHIHQQDSTFAIESGDLQTHYYGHNYPIKPKLTREGHLYTSFQPLLLRRIIKDRATLISTSDKALTDDWIFDLRNLINNSISLIDIAFTQLYIKAQYDPLPGWTFDKTILGERHGRRLNDKFKWVFHITGTHLNIEGEKKSLNTLRELRNHLMHFDPPSLVITLEEAVQWLNQIIDLGKILIKLRRAIGVDVSTDLINFLLQEEAIFVPFSEGKRQRINSNGKEDYYSSVWPSK